MPPHLNLRILFVLTLLAVLAAVEISQEHQPSFLRPGLRLNAYVSNFADGTISVVDLIRLSTIGTIAVGPAPMGLRALSSQKQVWGVSHEGGYVWVLDAVSGRLAARIAIGAAPVTVEFSPNGRRAYVPASGANSLIEIDTSSREIVAHTRTGRRPWDARVTPDGRLVLLTDRDDSVLELFDAHTLAPAEKFL